MNQPPIPKNEQERLQSLNDYYILDSVQEAAFDRITELASIICRVPISLISLIDEKRQWFKSKKGLDIQETDRVLSFCQYTIMDKELFEVPNALVDPRFMQNELVTGDPNIRFYSGMPLIDPGGYALGTLCVIDRQENQLTSDQKKALKLLAIEASSLIVERKRSNELKNFEALFLRSSDLICIASTNGYFKKTNPSFQAILGWDATQLLSKSFFELIHPDDITKTHEEILQLSKGIPTINFSVRFKTKSNDYRTLQWTATPDTNTGNLFAIGRDITDEQLKELQILKSEKQLKAFFENSQGLMCTHDRAGKFLSVNTAGASILGYTTKELLQLSLFDIVPSERHIYLKAYLAEVFAKGHIQGQMFTKHKDGSTRIWLFNNVLEQVAGGPSYVIGNAIDITEKHLLEIDLKHTQDLLQQSSRMARVGGWEMDLKEQKIHWTSITKEIHAVPPDFEPNLSTAINFYKEGENRASITAAVDLALATGQPWDLELQIVDANGEDKWIRAIGNASFKDGHCEKIFGTFQDIDARKQIELEVLQNKKLLDDVLNAASEVSIIATDREGIITVFNKGAEKLLGYKAAEIVGHTSPAIIHDPTEVLQRAEELKIDISQPNAGFRVFVANAEQFGSEQREWTYIKKDGSRLSVSLVVTAMRDLEGNISGYLGIATDITERKKVRLALISEKARLSAFVKHAPAAVAMLDKEMRYIAVSNKWNEDYELGSKDLTGLSHYEIYPQITEEGRQRHQRCLNGSIERKDEDVFISPISKKTYYVTWEMRPWYQYDGSVGGLMISTQNITSIVQQKEELKLAKMNADSASLAKSEFLANMSHEIRTPLNGVIGFTDLVLRTDLSETQAQYLSIVNQSANALLSIINDILDFSKIEAGKLDLDIEKCDLYEMSAQVTDIISYQIQSKGLEMLLNIPQHLPRFVWVDAVRLKQILINLLSNASKFTEKGEVELKIAVQSSNENRTIFRFSVRDTGIGIKKENQSKVFEAFSQEDGSTTKKYGGTGLGLTITNKLLQLMNSTLQLNSEYNVGSTFFFDIELKAEPGDPIHWENMDQINEVLIVDDNENNRIILQQMLALKQIETTLAKNGLEALELLSKGKLYDAILMDYHMPYMDGLETIKKIREFKSPISLSQAIILLHSSSDDETVIKACNQFKVSHRLVKPIKVEEIYDALSKLRKKENNTTHEYEVSKSASSCKALQILLAEDNAVNMLLAKAILNKVVPNATIWEAKNGLQAVQLCEERSFDIIIMDIQMPEMNGIEATEKIRDLATFKTVPIVALTAGIVKQEKEKCFDAGMDHFIIKPVVEDTLSTLFKNLFPENEVLEQEKKDTIIHFDPSQLRSYIDNNPELIKEVISLTELELQDCLVQLKNALSLKDITMINTYGHKLYGTAVTTGLPELARIAKALEHLKTIAPTEEASLTAALEKETKLVQKELKHFLNS